MYVSAKLTLLPVSPYRWMMAVPWYCSTEQWEIIAIAIIENLKKTTFVLL